MKELKVKQHFDLLGLKVEDKVTGAKGVVTSVSFDLYGCIAALVSFAKEDGTSTLDWLDVTRLKIKSNKPVMDLPNYDLGYVEKDKNYITEGKKGFAYKPIP